MIGGVAKVKNYHEYDQSYENFAAHAILQIDYQGDPATAGNPRLRLQSLHGGPPTSYHLFLLFA